MRVEFFEGVDPAPSESQRSDHGGLVIGAAAPRIILPPGAREDEFPILKNPADWWFDFVYARSITSKEKMSARQWSGMIHEHHQRFGLAKILMDPGAGGGGVYIQREMRAPKQLILGVETEVVPIATTDDSLLVAVGNFILNLFKRGDKGVDSVWPNPENDKKSLAGDELLKDGLFSTFKGAMDSTQLGFPVEENKVGDWFRKPDVATWGPERKFALTNLAAVTKQLKGVVQATEEDGTPIVNRRNARIFTSIGRDDLMMAAMLAYAAFLIWLRSESWRKKIDDEDEAGFGGR